MIDDDADLPEPGEPIHWECSGRRRTRRGAVSISGDRAHAQLPAESRSRRTIQGDTITQHLIPYGSSAR
jgi:hypothetical protein